MAASIGDVARLAGVSRTTVSHVISGKRRVSGPIATRVREAMDQLRYVPSRTAQNLAHGTTRTIGLLVPDIGNSYYADIAKGVESAAIERGFNVVLCNTGWNFERELFYIETLKSRAVDGVIYAAGALGRSSQIKDLLAGMPVVAVDEELGEVARATVISDNFAGGHMAAEHFSALGHEHALIVGFIPQLTSNRLRRDGFADAWAESGGGPLQVAEGPLEQNFGYSAVRERIEIIRRNKITAIFALNDMVALGVLQALAEANIPVPEACSVVGFDDIFTARHITPGLTTIRQDAVAMGTISADILLNVLERTDEESGGRRLLDVCLVERQTTAPVKEQGADKVT